VFLRNAVRSIRRFTSDPVCVVDDDSDDPETRAILASLEESCHVLHAPASAGGKHGGLYANMQRALDAFTEAELLCFLQDDMQMLRAPGDEELQAFVRHCNDPAGPAFLQPCFLKGGSRDVDRRSLAASGEAPYYVRSDNGASAGRYYSDVCIFSPRRLSADGWRFAPSEAMNERQAATLYPPMGQLRAPFLMWLPNVPAWRGKRKTWALRYAERASACGFHPYRCLDAEAERRLLDRDPAVLPVAEDFLSLEDETLVPRPWRYYPLQGRGLLKKLNSLELALRRLSGATRG
jgi:glycosyltransferase involved in cell wall biosynthesis